MSGFEAALRVETDLKPFRHLIFRVRGDRKSTRLNSSHDQISYAVFCLKKKKKKTDVPTEMKSVRSKSRNRQQKARIFGCRKDTQSHQHDQETHERMRLNS